MQQGKWWDINRLYGVSPTKTAMRACLSAAPRGQLFARCWARPQEPVKAARHCASAWINNWNDGVLWKLSTRVREEVRVLSAEGRCEAHGWKTRHRWRPQRSQCRVDTGPLHLIFCVSTFNTEKKRRLRKPSCCSNTLNEDICVKGNPSISTVKCI